MKVLGIDFETANEQRCSPYSVGRCQEGDLWRRLDRASLDKSYVSCSTV